MGKTINNFFLLLWKNFLLQWRHPIQTIVEILIPALFAIILVVLRSASAPNPHSAKLYSPFEINSWNYQSQVWWYPNSTDLFEMINNISSNKSNLTFQEFNSASEVYNHYQEHQYNLSDFLAIVEFSGLYVPNEDENNHKAKIKFRFPAESMGEINFWKTDKLFPAFQTQGPRNWWSNTGGYPDYNSEKFLTLQKELSLAFIKRLSENKTEDLNNLKITMQRFPYPKWIEDPLLVGLESAIGSFVMLSFVYTCISIVKVITYEKEKQLKEAMKIMGLPSWLHWTAWFIKSFTILIVSAIVMTVLLKVQWYPKSSLSVFTYSDATVIFVFLLLYMCATITFSFAISAFFSKANTAAVMAGILWFLTYLPFTFLNLQDETAGLTAKLSASSLFNTAVGFGFQIMLSFEGLEEGIQWSNVWTPTTPDDRITLGYLMLMLIFDTVLYLLIALYFEIVFPGEYGVPQPFYFLFTKSFWFNNVEETTSFEAVLNPNHEAEPTHLKPSIQLRNLSKKFSKQLAVKDLSLNIYQDQITVLLGHNGAGKTTTMSMLSGMIPPTSGTALINGYSIQKNMKKIRESFGLCPQHNILFDDLTVKEHIYFYSKLKGMTNKKEITEEIERYIKLLQFESKANSKSSTLSGGMKRKLSVAIALCGNSKVVMCDEPTAGIDPSTRRALWDFLKTEKKGRTILLTTHFMDEADLLGDRIIIMANGQLQCCGSSFFLKKRYGTGYKLIMDISEKCDVGKVTSLLQNFIPKLQETSKIGSELIYTLSEDYVSYFESMLESLETQSDNLGVLSYGISLTTLEEVFMKVGDIERHNDNIINNQFEEIIKTSNIKNNPLADTTVEFGNDLLLGWSLWRNQVLAMATKKSISTYRSWIAFLIQNLIPVFFLSLTIVLVRNAVKLNDPPNLKFDLNSYNNPVAVLTANEGDNNSYIKAYQDLLGDRLKYWENEDMSTQMINITTTSRSEVRRSYIAGASFDHNDATAWFNNDPYHASPLSLQLLMNSILQALVGNEYSLEFYNHPLPYTVQTRMQQMDKTSNMGFQIGFNLGFSLAFTSAFYTMFYIRERANKAKHLQFVSGITLTSFWSTSYICDILSFLFTSVVIMITLLIFQEDGFKTADELGRVFSILLTFGLSMLPLMYLASLFFDVAASGYTKTSMINIFTGVVLMLVIEVLKLLEIGIADFLTNLFLLFPHYSFSTAILQLQNLSARKSFCASISSFSASRHDINGHDSQTHLKNDYCEQIPDYYDFESPGIGKNILLSFLGGFIFMTILVIIENGTLSNLKYKICNRTLKSVDKYQIKEDDDVLQEKQKIEGFSHNDIKNYAVVMKNISKYFKNIAAVNNLSLAISKFECFGLLGVNGAGKTTTFKLLTGDIKHFYGNAWINGLSLRTDKKKINKLIGYCPQFDALLDDLTCKENLIIFGLTRGLTLNDSKLEANKLSKQFDFHQHINKKVKELSGGNKRKLSTSIALIGNPSVIYLDEPTTGMDPATKRFLWNVLCKIRDSGKCIVLTSHSMDECEALCTRLAIMVNGEFMCLGSTQHLKSKYSNGYLLTIKLKRNENYNEIGDTALKAVETFVKDTFLNVEIQEQHKELITFTINDKTKTWSKMFGILEKAKIDLNIEDYLLGQNSLEQIFISFAKKQIIHANKDDNKKMK